MTPITTKPTVATLGASTRVAIGGRSGTARLSAATAAKQARRHSDLRPENYALVQRILDEGQVFLARRANHAVGFLEVDGKLWRVVVKATADGLETYVLSLHHVEPHSLAAARVTAEVILPISAEVKIPS